MIYNRPIPVERIVSSIGERAQTNTQQYGKRPYGVGLLVAGVDETGPHLFEFQPSGMTQEMVACAIGARSQMARTYLERSIDNLLGASRENLIKHGLQALKESLSQDKELTVENCSVGVVGVGKDGKVEKFVLYDGESVKQWVDLVSDGNEGSDDAPAGEMEVDS